MDEERPCIVGRSPILRSGTEIMKYVPCSVFVVRGVASLGGTIMEHSDRALSSFDKLFREVSGHQALALVAIVRADDDFYIVFHIRSPHQEISFTGESGADSHSVSAWLVMMDAIMFCRPLTEDT